MLLALWLVFAGSFGAHELVLGAIAAGLGVLGSQVVRAEAHVSLRGIDPRWLAAAWRLPVQVVSDTWSLLRILAVQLVGRRRARSLLVAAPFDCEGDDPRSAARRALAIAWTNLTPAVVVLGFDRRRGRIIYHQLEPGPLPPFTRDLGARP